LLEWQPKAVHFVETAMTVAEPEENDTMDLNSLLFTGTLGGDNKTKYGDDVFTLSPRTGQLDSTLSESPPSLTWCGILELLHASWREPDYL
jgi:hypothetical protein